MELRTNITQAFSNLLSSKMRSFLAVLGILVGTGSVVAMVLCGQIATQMALKQFKVLGTNLLSVGVNPRNHGGSDSFDPFTVSVANGVVSASPEIDIAAPYTFTYAPISYQGEQLNGSIIGVTSNLSKVIKVNVDHGRFISDLDGYATFCVLGSRLYQRARDIAGKDPIGTQIRFGENIYTIIGGAAPWPENNFFYQDINESILIPIQSSYILSKYTRISNVVMELDEGADIDEVQNAITAYVNDKAPGMSLFFRSAKQIIQSMQDQSRIFTMLLGLIGSISLLVGGIGVMNIMLVSVTERKREIGIRMAIGARRKDIRTLFLVESVMLSLFGGSLGVAIGILITYIIAHFAGWDFMFFMLPPLVGFGVSVGIGVFFGFYPAYKASQLDPIQTLRSE